MTMRSWGALLGLSCALALTAGCGDDDDSSGGEGEGEGEGECGPDGAQACGGSDPCVPPGGGCCSCAEACDEWDCSNPANNPVDCPEQGGFGTPCGREATCEYCIEGFSSRFTCTGGMLSPLDGCTD